MLHPSSLVLSAQAPHMRDFVVHLAWLCTHAIRTLLDRDNTPSLLASLSEEVKVLQAELHRAHRLIEGYNLAFEREERAGQFHLRGLEVFTCIIAILTGLLAWAWLCPRRPTPPQPVKAITGVPEVRLRVRSSLTTRDPLCLWPRHFGEGVRLGHRPWEKDVGSEHGSCGENFGSCGAASVDQLPTRPEFHGAPQTPSGQGQCWPMDSGLTGPRAGSCGPEHGPPHSSEAEL